MTSQPPPSLERMEDVYDTIARAIDTAGPQAEVFLAKALFILGSRHVSREDFDAAIDMALADLRT